MQEAREQHLDGRCVLDDVDWQVISQQMGSRNFYQCMDTWWVGGRVDGGGIPLPSGVQPYYSAPIRYINNDNNNK